VAADTDRRLTNLVGAFALALTDRVREATEATAHHTAAGPSALVALHEFVDGRSLEELRQVVGLTHSGTVRLVDRLAEQGHVERRTGRDGRSVALVLTARGRRVAQRVIDARAQAIDALLTNLSDDERSALAALTERLLAAVTEDRLGERARGRLPAGGWLCRQCDFDACGRPRGECPIANTAAARIA